MRKEEKGTQPIVFGSIVAVKAFLMPDLVRGGKGDAALFESD
jgi:hypothetical protein